MACEKCSCSCSKSEHKLLGLIAAFLRNKYPEIITAELMEEMQAAVLTKCPPKVLKSNIELATPERDSDGLNLLERIKLNNFLEQNARFIEEAKRKSADQNQQIKFEVSYESGIGNNIIAIEPYTGLRFDVTDYGSW